MSNEENGAITGSLRLDKWLWYARFFKSRSLATRLCADGRVRIDSQRAEKAHVQVRPGQVLTFVKDGRVRVVRVVALGTRRGPAPEAQALYEDLSPEVAGRPAGNPDVEAGQRERGAGRPTKKERRAVDRIRGD